MTGSLSGGQICIASGIGPPIAPNGKNGCGQAAATMNDGGGER